VPVFRLVFLALSFERLVFGKGGPHHIAKLGYTQFGVPLPYRALRRPARRLKKA
jgi:hypothetical protein